jgi:hypothetical protein
LVEREFHCNMILETSYFFVGLRRRNLTNITMPGIERENFCLTEPFLVSKGHPLTLSSVSLGLGLCIAKTRIRIEFETNRAKVPSYG